MQKTLELMQMMEQVSSFFFHTFTICLTTYFAMPLPELLRGAVAPEVFIEFLKQQPNLVTLQGLSWAQSPIWQVFLSTNPTDSQLHQWMVLYQSLGGELLELNTYKESLFDFRLERATNCSELSLSILVETFGLIKDIATVERNGKAWWTYCLNDALSASDQQEALTLYHQKGGHLGFKGPYGSIFKALAERCHRSLWIWASRHAERPSDELFVVGGEGAERLAFCTFLHEQEVAITYWGEETFAHALRDDDLELLDHLLALGWRIDTNNTDYFNQANSVAVFQRFIQAGVTATPSSTYPFDCPIYTLVYNLKGRIDQYKKNAYDFYLESIERDKTKLQLLLQYQPQLPTNLDYGSDYPSLALLLSGYPSILTIIQDYTNTESYQWLEQAIRDLPSSKD